MSDEKKAQELISIFNCEKDKDIENFIRERAILFEKLGKSRTYLIFDEDEEEFKVLAYFTLAMQVLKIPEDLLSNRKTKFLDGFSSKIRGEKITEFPTILIGQVGKNDLFKELISGNEIMQYCLSTVFKGQAVLAGRIIMLECKDVPYIINLYKKFGFQKLEKDYDEDEHIQMIKILEEDEIIEPQES
jgi:predicted GNAT family N-acyltransferase